MDPIHQPVNQVREAWDVAEDQAAVEQAAEHSELPARSHDPMVRRA